MIDPRRLQRHLRETLRQQSIPARVGPYTCYFHPEAPYAELNVAIPDEPPEGKRIELQGRAASGLAAVPDDDPEYAIMMVEAQFRARRRVPHVEFIAECHPELPEVLQRAGFAETTRVPVFASFTGGAANAPEAPGIRVEGILPSSSWETTRLYLEVQREAYGLDHPLPEKAPKDAWPALGIGAGVLATLEGAPVGACGFTPPVDGLTEIRGLAVKPSAQRRSIGAFLLHAIARVAHEGGLEAVLAIPDGPSTARLAKRAGYSPVATLVGFTSEASSGP